VSRVCPQGGMLSPTTPVIPHCQLFLRLKEVVYVLRVMLTIPACWQWTNSQTLSGLIQKTIYTVEVWCVEVGLSVNADKMDLVVFTRKRNLLVSLNFISLHLPCPVMS